MASKRRRIDNDDEDTFNDSQASDQESHRSDDDLGDVDEELEDLQDDGDDEGGEEEEEEEGDVTSTATEVADANISKKVQSTPKPKGRRGRKPLLVLPSVITDTGKSYEIIDDEYNLTEDEEGETKVKKNGELLGGREYKVRTFTLKGKGDKLWMLSTEPARCVGFRDSYLLFQRHKLLHKYVVDQDEKFDLIDRDIIPHSYKGRTIGLVTARSIFREFGAKVIVGGRYVQDDYYPQRVKALEHIKEGELAEPEPPAGGPAQYVAWNGAASTAYAPASFSQPMEAAELKSMKLLRGATHLSEENWMFKHAEASATYNSTLSQKRNNLLLRGLKDSYTGQVFIPNGTQPTKVKFAKVNDGEKKKVVYEVRMEGSFVRKTGLNSVELDLFSDCVDEATKAAILKQQDAENLL